MDQYIFIYNSHTCIHIRFSRCTNQIFQINKYSSNLLKTYKKKKSYSKVLFFSFLESWLASYSELCLENKQDFERKAMEMMFWGKYFSQT